MWKPSLVLAVAALSLGFAPAPFPKPDPTKEDVKKMQGTWVAPDGAGAGGFEVVIKGNQLSYLRNGTVISAYTLTLDGAKKPKGYESKGVDASAGRMFVGIYSVEGDTLKFCYNGAANRPKSFEGPGKGTQLEVYKRVKR